MTIQIPKLEPEVIAAEAKKFGGDHEKVATTSIKRLVVGGVEITSRYQKAHEFELMSKMVGALPAALRRHVKSIFCDSKACASYTVVLRQWNQDVAEAVARYLEAAAIAHDGGYNDISICEDDSDCWGVNEDGHPVLKDTASFAEKRRFQIGAYWEGEY
jgi:hypothetical protein